MISNPIKKKPKKSIHFHGKEKEQFRKSSSQLKIKSLDIKINLEKIKKKKINILQKVKTNHSKIDEYIKSNQYKDCELNSFDYQMALKYDKRTFFQYYISLLKSKHVILFSFYPINDYNIKIIKVSLFFLSFDIYFAVNTFFF